MSFDPSDPDDQRSRERWHQQVWVAKLALRVGAALVWFAFTTGLAVFLQAVIR